jgi:hypothetical protein
MTITPQAVAALAEDATPGPWNVDPAHNRDVQANGSEIATAFMDRDVGEEMVVVGPIYADEDEGIANAALIAAAPDMAALIAAQAAEIERLRVGLSDLIDHVEAINSEWADNLTDATALKEARQAIKGTKP